MANLYNILGLKENASDIEIRQAYKKLAFKFHPDKNPDPSSTEKFKEIAHAYQILSNPKKKSIYDQYGENNEDYETNDMFDDMNDNWVFQDIFNSFFNGTTTSSQTNKIFNTNISMNVSIKEAMSGTLKKQIINVKEKCNDCKGKGFIIKNKCDICNGTGKIIFNKHFIQIQQICNKCKGKGYKEKIKCINCNYLGYIEKEKEIEITIPAGISDGEEIIFKFNKEKNIGDVYIKIYINNTDLIKIKNHDIFLQLNLDVIDLILGTQLNIPYFNETITFKIKPGTQIGTIHTVKNKGYFYKKNKRGDLFIILNAIIPDNITKLETKILKSFKNINKNNNINKDLNILKTIFSN